MKKAIRSIFIFITLIIVVLVGLLIKLRIQTDRILTEYSFEIPKAMRGLSGYAVNVFVYSLVFISYLFCRILRSVYRNRKEAMAKMQIIGVMVSLLLATIGTSYIMRQATNQGKELVQDLPEVAGARKTSRYIDGTYHGTGMGNNGKIGVDVTISDGEIKEIRITDFPDDADYFDVDSDGASMIQKILESQGTDVDTVSGATYSSEGIIDAVNAALSEATS